MKKNNNKTNNSIKKWTDNLKRISPNKIYKWSINAWKNSKSLTIREIWIKTTIRYHLILIRKITFKNNDNNKLQKITELGKKMKLWSITSGNVKEHMYHTHVRPTNLIPWLCWMAFCLNFHLPKRLRNQCS